jgi:hypothetical protein
MINLCHEIADQYNLPCIRCGVRYEQIHHYPKRQHKIPEVLYISAYPVCAICHAEIHTSKPFDHEQAKKYFSENLEKCLYIVYNNIKRISKC